MGISDNEVQKQLSHMMAFIEQEANEKAEEIDAKAEEEYTIEKGRLVQQQRAKIMEYYDKKKKQVVLQKKIHSSNMLNEGRLQCLKAREEHLSNVLEEARSNLSQISGSNKYPEILSGLIKQALYQMLESEVELKCRKQDVPLIGEILPKALDELERVWGDRTKVLISSDYLPENSAGGVELTAKGGKIKVTSTLESRLDLIAKQITPQIRTALFGANPNRSHFD
uniref:V-type proton ATPase subunit E 2 (inferred by orthology to a human protein) n=1 Tax=Strongyloides venezuelensis TaxID=75913 RepID=A0A0K0FH20_STRVS